MVGSNHHRKHFHWWIDQAKRKRSQGLETNPWSLFGERRKLCSFGEHGRNLSTKLSEDIMVPVHFDELFPEELSHRPCVARGAVAVMDKREGTDTFVMASGHGELHVRSVH